MSILTLNYPFLAYNRLTLKLHSKKITSVRLLCDSAAKLQAAVLVNSTACMERNIQGRNENLPQITIDPKVWLSLCSYRQDVEEHALNCDPI